MSTIGGTPERALKLLRDGKPRSARQIVEDLGLSISDGSMAIGLKLLETKKLVTSTKETDGRRRRMYALARAAETVGAE